MKPLSENMQLALIALCEAGRLHRTVAGFQAPGAVLDFHPFRTVYALEARGLATLDPRQRLAEPTDLAAQTVRLVRRSRANKRPTIRYRNSRERKPA